MTPEKLIAQFALETAKTMDALCAPVQRKHRIARIRRDIIETGIVKYRMSEVELAKALNITQGFVSKVLKKQGHSRRKIQQMGVKHRNKPKPKPKLKVERYSDCTHYSACLDKFSKGNVKFNCVGCAKLEKREAI